MIWNLEEFFKSKKDCLNSIERLDRLYNKLENYKTCEFDNENEINDFLKFYNVYSDLKNEFESYFDLLEIQNYQDNMVKTLKGKFKITDTNMANLFDEIFSKIESKIEKYKESKDYLKYKAIIQTYEPQIEYEFMRHENAFYTLENDLASSNVRPEKLKHTYLEIINNYYNSIIENIDNPYIEEVLSYHPEISYKDLKKLFKIISNNSYLNSIYPKIILNDSVFKVPNTEYLKAQEQIYASLNVLGEDYRANLKDIFSQNRIDHEIRKNKQDIDVTYSTKNHKAFASIHYRKDIESILILSHELGHMVEHNYKYNKDAKIKDPATELYSLTNELITGKYLLKNANTLNEKINISLKLINIYMTNIFENISTIDLSLKVGKTIEKNGYIDLKNINNISSNIINKYNLLASRYFWITSDLFENLNQLLYVYGIIGASNICSNIENKTFDAKDYIESLKKGPNESFEVYNTLGCNPLDENNISKTLSSYKNLLENTQDLVHEKKKRR